MRHSPCPEGAQSRGRSKVSCRFYWAEIKVPARLHSFLEVQGDSVSLPVWLLERPPSFLGLWLFHLQSHSRSSPFLLHLSDPLFSLFLHFKDSCG